MHKCLFVSEIVNIICLELVRYPLDQQYSGTLAALAATCHAISEPVTALYDTTHHSLVFLVDYRPLVVLLHLAELGTFESWNVAIRLSQFYAQMFSLTWTGL